MQFRKCSIAGVGYGKGTTEMGLARLKRLGLPLPEGGAKEGAQSANKVVNFEANPNPNPTLTLTLTLTLTVRSLARRGLRVAPRVCDPQVAAALLQPGEPDAATLPQLVHRFSESLPQLARAGGADARMLAHERCCLAAVRSQAAMVHLARLLQADGLTLTLTLS